MALEILPFFEPESYTWSYLVGDKDYRLAAIIDPVWVYDPDSGRTDTAFTDNILAEARRRRWKVKNVLETHAHADHLSSAGYIKKKTRAKVGIGKGICSVQSNCKRLFNLPDFQDDGRQFDLLFENNDCVDLGYLTFRVMNTPGHTPDSITYLLEDNAFIGDTLFAPAMGSARCDFPGGEAGELYDSIQKIYALSPETQLFLCHDYPEDGADPRSTVTVSESKQENIHVTGSTSRDEFIQLRTSRDATLGLPRLIIPSLQVNMHGGKAFKTYKKTLPHLNLPEFPAFAEQLAELSSPGGTVNDD